MLTTFFVYILYIMNLFKFKFLEFLSILKDWRYCSNYSNCLFYFGMHSISGMFCGNTNFSFLQIKTNNLLIYSKLLIRWFFFFLILTYLNQNVNNSFLSYKYVLIFYVPIEKKIVFNNQQTTKKSYLINDL